MYGTKLAQMPNDLPMGLGERLPRAGELAREKADREAAIKAYQRTAFFEKADHTFNHELAKLKHDGDSSRHAEAWKGKRKQKKQRAEGQYFDTALYFQEQLQNTAGVGVSITANPCLPKAPPNATQIFDSLAETFGMYQSRIGPKMKGDDPWVLSSKYRKAKGTDPNEALYWTWDHLASFNVFCCEEAGRVRQALAEEELGKQREDYLIQRQEAEKNPPKAPWAQASTVEIFKAFEQARKSYKAAGGCGMALSDLYEAYDRKVGIRRIVWTHSQLVEFEQFAGQVGAEEAAARARSPVEGAPKESDWVDIDF